MLKMLVINLFSQYSTINLEPTLNTLVFTYSPKMLPSALNLFSQYHYLLLAIPHITFQIIPLLLCELIFFCEDGGTMLCMSTCAGYS